MRLHTHPRAARLAILSLGLLALAGCGTVSRSPPTPTSAPAAKPAPAPDGVRDDLGAAMIQPFTDFNLARSEIPAPLKAAVLGPYASPGAPGCAVLSDQVGALDAVLGPDLDQVLVKAGRSEDASRMVAGALRSLTTGWIPLRGILRRLTGAEAHAEAVRASILAGAVRRAYLKGLGDRDGCPPPASPLRPPSDG